MGAKHTPGPWYFSRMERPPIGRQPNGEPWPTDANGNVFWGYSIGGRNENGAAILPTLAAVHNFPDQIDANVSLIAAAPELLDALISLVAWTKFELSPEMQQIKPWSSVLAKCEAAIAKAEGRIPDIQIKGAA